MIKINKKKNGMLVLSIAVGLVFISIIFASLMNRVRQEAVLTNRVSINERLNQLACAVGRIAIRKLQRDIELRNNEEGNEHGAKIVKEITVGGKNESSDNYSTVINNIPVVCKLKESFEQKWGSQGAIKELKVEYNVHLTESDISVDGSKSDESKIRNFPFSKKGYADLNVTIALKSGYSRKYTIRKEFILATLLAPPFCRYTLFSHNGATIKNEVANAIKYTSDGEVSSGGRPLVCLNRKIDACNRVKRNYLNSPTSVISKADDFVRNGWIYLGGKNDFKDSTSSHKNALVLNVVPGCGDDDLRTKFGEYFHFYFNQKNAGWLTIDGWNVLYDTWMKSNHSYNGNEEVRVSFVNYGLYNGLLDIPFGSLSDYFLFKDHVEENYNNNIPVKDTTIKNGFSSSMHLFGTPKHCTPTLIFGQVNRRYLRAFGLYLPGLSRVFPLKVLAKYVNTEDIGGEFSDLINSFNEWYDRKSTKSDSEKDAFKLAFNFAFTEDFLKIGEGNPDYDQAFDYYFQGNRDDLPSGLSPFINDQEPYANALINMCQPESPSEAKITANDFCQFNADELCVDNFQFTDNHFNESLYKGFIRDIKIDYDKYLKDLTTYTFCKRDDQGNIIKNADFVISDNDEDDEDIVNKFFKNHFFQESESKLFSKKKTYFMLNQIVRINGNLTIKKELFCARGGIIICNGKVTIDAPIINRHLHPDYNPGSDPNKFGFLTIIAKKGIEITPNAINEDLQTKTNSPLPLLEAFLISGCGGDTNSGISISKPMRIIGSVAADDITDLVKTGCIIEWGFDQESNDISTAFDNDQDALSYCGLSLGPRDIEIYSSGE